MTGPRLVTVQEVAVMTRLAEKTLYDWRKKKKGPPSFTLGCRRIVYVEQDVLDWLAAQQDASTQGDQP